MKPCEICDKPDIDCICEVCKNCHTKVGHTHYGICDSCIAMAINIAAKDKPIAADEVWDTDDYNAAGWKIRKRIVRELYPGQESILYDQAGIIQLHHDRLAMMGSLDNCSEEK